MALFKIYKGLSDNLKNTPNPQKEDFTKKTKEGHCYFTTDDGKFYIDIVDDVAPVYPDGTYGGGLSGVTRMPINSYKSDWSARAFADAIGKRIDTWYGHKLQLTDTYNLSLIAGDETTVLNSITLPSNVETAKKFTSNQTIKLTGAVTGEKSSQAGWEIATTLANNIVTTAKINNSAVTNAKIADGAVTNGKIANSTISNAKLVNSSININGASVSLGGSLTLADIGLSSALRFIGVTATAIVDGGTTSPISVNGSNVTPTIGDVVINSNNNQEYVWLGSAWELLGDESSYALKDHTHSVATESANGLLSKEDKIKLNNTNIAYGTCSTAAATAAKVITLNGNTQWALKNGSLIMVKFANSNTASNVTLNVNGTGAYPIWYNNAAYTSTSSAYCGYKDRTITYMFNGTHWVWISSSYDANTQSNTNSTDTDSKIFIIGATSQGSNKTTYSHDTAYVGTDGCLYSGGEKVLTSYTDTKNTAGSTNSSSKLFLIGATTQAANPQTYSHDTAYVGTDGCLYSNSTKVSVEGHTHNQYLQNAYTSIGVNSNIHDAVGATSLNFKNGAGISLSMGAGKNEDYDITITNSGVRSVTSGSTNGTISVNTNGTSNEVAVKGLKSAAYTDESSYIKSISIEEVSGNLTPVLKYTKSNGTTTVGNIDFRVLQSRLSPFTDSYSSAVIPVLLSNPAARGNNYTGISYYSAMTYCPDTGYLEGIKIDCGLWESFNGNIDDCCFIAGTQVLIDLSGNTKNIEDIKPGDNAVAYNLTEEKNYLAIVKKVHVKHDVTDVAVVNFENGATLIMNAYHPIYTVNGYHSLTNHNGYDMLLIGDNCRTEKGWSKIISIDRYNSTPITMYSLDVIDINENIDNDINDNFFANGIVVHNASCPT